MAAIQDKIILGLLMFRDRSAYDVKKAIENSTAFFYKASMGSIHPALKKLLANKLVTVSDLVDNGRLKKIYAITPAGKKTYISWLEQGLDAPDVRDETLVRLFFFGHLDEESRREHLKVHIALLDKKILRLQDMQDQMKEANIPHSMRDHALFQLATLDHGLQYYRFTRTWYQDFFDKNFGEVPV